MRFLSGERVRELAFWNLLAASLHEMAGRYDSNPFDEDEVNPFSVSKSSLLGYRIHVA